MADRRVITFSRRTDPAFYMDWFMDKVEKGGCWVPNPRHGFPYYVSLKPEHVSLLNFWTKAPSAILPYLDRLRDFRIAFFITHTGYPGWIEPNVPDFETTAAAVENICNRLSSDALWWRYDPVLFSGRFDADWHVGNFKMFCERIWGGRTKRVIISLAHVKGPYSGIASGLEDEFRKQGDVFHPESHDEFVKLASRLASIARGHGIETEVCCSPIITPAEKQRYGVRQGECISRKALEALGMEPPDRRKPTRWGSKKYDYGPCRCLASTDIGANGTCRHLCIYCYAARRPRAQTGGISAESPWLSADPLPEGCPYPEQTSLERTGLFRSETRSGAGAQV